MILKSIIPSNLWTSIQSYVSTAAAAILPSQTGNNGKYLTTDGTSASWVDFFDESNAATAGGTVTINATSGVATFTLSVSPNATAFLNINNSEISANDLILWSVKYDNGGGILIPCYYRTINGLITFWLYNAASAGFPTSGDIVISFKKIN